MNRTLYFLTLFVTSAMINGIEGAMAINNVAVVVALMLIIAQVAAGLYRWQNMGYNKWWGLLAMFPIVPLYGIIMPPNAKTTGIDAAGKAWLAVIIILFVMVVALALSSGV